MKRKRFFEYEGLAVWPVENPSSRFDFINMEVNVEGAVFSIDAMRPKDKVRGDFLPTKISVKGQDVPVWTFDQLKRLGFHDMAMLFRLYRGDKHIDMIGLVDRGGYRLLSVIPLSSLGSCQLVNTKEYGIVCHGGFQLHELFKLKMELAKQEGMDCFQSMAEAALLSAIEKRREEVRMTEEARQLEAKKAEEDRLREEEQKKTQAREARRKEIVSRSDLVVYDEMTGKKFFGPPVTESEWQVFSNKLVVIVNFYDTETGEAGKPLAVVLVGKARGSGRPFKQLICAAPSLKPPEAEAVAMTVKLFFIEGQPVSAEVCRREELQEKAHSLNHGTPVAVPNGVDKYEVFFLEQGKPKSKGVFAAC